MPFVLYVQRHLVSFRRAYSPRRNAFIAITNTRHGPIFFHSIAGAIKRVLFQLQMTLSLLTLIKDLKIRRQSLEFSNHVDEANFVYTSAALTYVVELLSNSRKAVRFLQT